MRRVVSALVELGLSADVQQVNILTFLRGDTCILHCLPGETGFLDAILVAVLSSLFWQGTLF
jgi:hypothetical protein